VLKKYFLLSMMKKVNVFVETDILLFKKVGVIKFRKRRRNESFLHKDIYIVTNDVRYILFSELSIYQQPLMF